jgi:hypothetical protein
MMKKIFDMAYEVDGNCINIEQDAGFGEVNRVSLHPIHLRLLATEAGLMKGDEDAWRRVEALERRLLRLRNRVETLDQWIAEDVGKEAPDLAMALHSAFSEATLAMLDEWCSDVDPSTVQAAKTEMEPSGNPIGSPCKATRCAAWDCGPGGAAMNEAFAMAEVEAMLSRLRELRGDWPWGEVRQAFNEAADRLDVLVSKLTQERTK